MQLLTRMQSQDPGQAGEAEDLAARVPRLWPFFRHTLTSVRRSCVQCLRALLSADAGDARWSRPPSGGLNRAVKVCWKAVCVRSHADDDHSNVCT